MLTLKNGTEWETGKTAVLLFMFDQIGARLVQPDEDVRSLDVASYAFAIYLILDRVKEKMDYVLQPSFCVCVESVRRRKAQRLNDSDKQGGSIKFLSAGTGLIERHLCEHGQGRDILAYHESDLQTGALESCSSKSCTGAVVYKNISAGFIQRINLKCTNKAPKTSSGDIAGNAQGEKMILQIG